MAAIRALIQAGVKRRWGLDVDFYYGPEFKANDWKLVESVNAFGESFFEAFLTEDISEAFRHNIRFERAFFRHAYLEHLTAQTMKRHTRKLKRCLDLIEQTSKADYDASGKKWSRIDKEKEMLLPDMKYLLFWQSEMGEKISSNPNKDLIGFVSFMITYEDGKEVIYIYEIHFIERLRGLGYGGDLMDVVEAIGREVGVEKAMLTVFQSNKRAVNFYADRGYTVDPYSPKARNFRDGSAKEPKYLILSKEIKADQGIGRCTDAECPEHNKKAFDAKAREVKAEAEAKAAAEKERVRLGLPPPRRTQQEANLASAAKKRAEREVVAAAEAERIQRGLGPPRRAQRVVALDLAAKERAAQERAEREQIIKDYGEAKRPAETNAQSGPSTKKRRLNA